MFTPRWHSGAMRNETKPSVCVVGLGYIGLPTAAIIARAGCPVLLFASLATERVRWAETFSASGHRRLIGPRPLRAP